MIYLLASLIFLLGTAVTLTVFMSIYLYIRKIRRTRYTKWSHMSSLLIRKSIFFDPDPEIIDPIIPVTRRLNSLLGNSRFRNHLAKKIISAARSLSGHAFLNLKKLYLQLELDRYALKMIESGLWHKRAYGIQQLGVMELKAHLKQVYRYTNDRNELIRIEAQLAVLKLSGFEGLRFLDTASYQISEWQQIRLLKELSLLPHSNLTGIEQWLRSNNHSVVVFALKLARNYHHFELYDDILLCLEHTDPDVRKQAIVTLTDIYTADTSDELVKMFPHQPADVQLTLAKALERIGDNDDIPALISYLGSSNASLKLAIIRTLAVIGQGLDFLSEHVDTSAYPLNQMVAQIKTEMKL